MILTDLYNYLEGSSNGLKWDMELCKRIDNPKCIEKYGYKVYSQNDEDGIIAEIFRRIGVVNKKFIEFGVQDGIESNGHYLLLKGWQGLWLEYDDILYQKILTKFQHVIETQQLTVGREFITRDNIDSIFQKYNMTGEIDLLSVDVDGNDYHIWNSINAVDARVVVIEYNAKMPPDCEWVMPYYEEHIWDGGDNHGASLLSLAKLGKQLGYALVGTNMSGVNAFFVREDCLAGKFAELSVEELYNPARYNKKFNIGNPSLYCLKNLPEGRRQEFVGKNDRILMKTGFHEQEKNKDIMCWMSGSEAHLLIDLEGKQDKGSNIAIQYVNPVIEICSDAAPKLLGIKIEGKVIIEKYELGNRGTIYAEIPEKCIKTDNILDVAIIVDKTWCPYKLQMSEDMRKLGIGIVEISIEKSR